MIEFLDVAFEIQLILLAETRKKLVQFFEAWGPNDDATIEGRKRLSTILFS